MIETVRYTYRLRPGAMAERALLEEWGRCRWLWNEAVHQQRSGCKPTFCKLSKLLTAARTKNAWLRDGSQNAQQQMLRTYMLALDHSFKVKGCRKPTIKRRKDATPSLGYTVNGFSIRTSRLHLAKGISIPVVWSRDLPSKPSSCRVYQDNLGYWYVSFVVTRKVAPVSEATRSIGIDWGVSTTATTTNPAYDLPYGGHRKRCAAELARAQRRMSRRHRRGGQPQSNGYRRAKREAAKLHKKAARQNSHASHVWAKRVVNDHQVIAVEDFKPGFLAKSTLARKARDAAIGAAKRTLIEYGTRAGREVVLVPPAYTTMTCAECGTRAKERLTLAERTFRCESCGYAADRDRNAARVILAMAERIHAGADDVRHVTRFLSEADDVLSEPGISRL
jgi:putative transposase